MPSLLMTGSHAPSPEKSVLIFILVGIANILDVEVIGTGSVLRTAIIFFYLSNETSTSRMLAMPTKMKIRTFRQMPRKPTSLDSFWSAMAVEVIGTGSVLRTAIIFFYLSNEGVSLLENAAHLGWFQGRHW